MHSYSGINNIMVFGSKLYWSIAYKAFLILNFSLPFVCVDIHLVRMENWLLVKLNNWIFLYGLSLKVNVLSETINSNILQIPVHLYKRAPFVWKPIWGWKLPALSKPKSTCFMLKCIIFNVKRKRKVFKDLTYGVNSKTGSNTCPVINVNHNPDIYLLLNLVVFGSMEGERGY